MTPASDSVASKRGSPASARASAAASLLPPRMRILEPLRFIQTRGLRHDRRPSSRPARTLARHRGARRGRCRGPNPCRQGADCQRQACRRRPPPSRPRRRPADRRMRALAEPDRGLDPGHPRQSRRAGDGARLRRSLLLRHRRHALGPCAARGDHLPPGAVVAVARLRPAWLGPRRCHHAVALRPADPHPRAGAAAEPARARALRRRARPLARSRTISCARGFGHSVLHVLEALGGPRERVRATTADRFGSTTSRP